MRSNDDSTHKFDKLRRQAEDLIQNRPSTAVAEPADILELIHELQIHQAELEIQNEELKQAQLELTDLYRKFEDIYEFAPCGYLNLNAKGLIISINLAGLKLLDNSRKSILNTGLSRFVAAGWTDSFLKALRQAGQTGEKQSLELQLGSTKKAQRWVLAEIQADRMDADVVKQFRVMLVDISSKKEIEVALQASEEKYRKLFNDMVGCAVLLEIAEHNDSGKITDLRILEVNAACEALTGIQRDQAVGGSVRQILPQTEGHWFEMVDQAMRNHQPIQIEGYHRDLKKHLLLSGFRLDDKHIGITFIDISAHKRIQQDLEVQVKKRTSELQTSNLNLRKEIKSRERIQKALQKNSLELEAQAARLQEANAALKVLLSQYMDERRVLEEKVVSNINELIRPNLARLGSGNLSQRQRTLLDAVSSNLDNIISPMSRRFILEGSQLTPAQTQVADLIRQGKTTKEIAELLGVATSTVDFHRINIRRSLNLTKKRVNLQAYLKALK